MTKSESQDAFSFLSSIIEEDDRDLKQRLSETAKS